VKGKRKLLSSLDTPTTCCVIILALAAGVSVASQMQCLISTFSNDADECHWFRKCMIITTTKKPAWLSASERSTSSAVDILLIRSKSIWNTD